MSDTPLKGLIEHSGKSRGKENAAHPSLLVGKLLDETGDRLTPSHANKNGKRFRYYISRRLVVDKSIKHPEAWRLSAPQLEKAITLAARGHFPACDLLPRLVKNSDIIEQTVSGTLPLHFTSDYLIKAGVPADWSQQRKMLEEPTYIRARN